MSLVVEDGSQVDGANTYASATDAMAYAAARGLAFPPTAGEVGPLLLRAMDFLESLGARFKGERTNPAEQELSWPRSGVYLHGYELADDAIPAELINAQCQLAVDLQTQDLQPLTAGQNVKREKVDVLEVEYEDRKGLPSIPRSTKAEAFLQPLLRQHYSLRTQRV